MCIVIGYLIILFLYSPNIFSQTKSDNIKDLKVSIIIPCHIKHIQHLHGLLKLYTRQTRLPNEIIVSVSEADAQALLVVDKITQEVWPFKLIVLTSKAVLYAGQNRNIACTHASGDIFICQDADDIPHPQRTEIIAYFFEHYNIDHLAHTYIMQPKEKAVKFSHYSVNKIKYFNPKQLASLKNIEITNGNVSISRQLFKVCKWPADKKGQDLKFNKMVYTKCNSRLVLNVPLISYRMYLSSHESHCLIASKLAQR